MPDDRKYKDVVPHLWSMSGTEDLLRYMWERGEFKGECSGESFDLNCVKAAFEQRLVATLEQAQADFYLQHIPDFAGAEAEGAQVSYIQLPPLLAPVPESELPPDAVFFNWEKFRTENISDLQDLVQLRSDLYQIDPEIIELVESMNFGTSADKSQGYIESYLYLAALESGEELPFLPDFDPYLLRNYAAEAVYDMGYIDPDYDFSYEGDLNKAIVEQDVFLLMEVLSQIDETSDLYFLKQMAIDLGVSEDSIAMYDKLQAGSSDFQSMVAVLESFLPEDYTPEDAAALSYTIFSSAYMEFANTPF